MPCKLRDLSSDPQHPHIKLSAAACSSSTVRVGDRRGPGAYRLGSLAELASSRVSERLDFRKTRWGVTKEDTLCQLLGLTSTHPHVHVHLCTQTCTHIHTHGNIVYSATAM